MGILDSLYASLGVAPGATDEELKKAFRKIARTCHPDVAGDDPAKAKTFLEAREAYETLIDPAKRAALEAAIPRAGATRRPKRAAEDHGQFFRAFYKRASGVDPGAPAGPPPRASARPRGASIFDGGGAAGQDFVDDVFKDFGFGGGGSAGGSAARARTGGPPPPNQGGRTRRGDDVLLDLDIEPLLAQTGGTLTVPVVHLGRDPAWRVGDPSPGVQPTQSRVTIEVPPGARHASHKRIAGHGDAGPWGGPPGDLLVRFRIADGGRAAEPTRTVGPDAPESKPAGHEVRQPLPLTLGEAALGGRVEVSTPQGRVRIAIPACTSSGRAFRLRGKGPAGPDGQPMDLVFEARIVLPASLDEASRALLEQFAERNPEVPDR